MLPRARRLHADRDIRRLLQRGARKRDTFFQLTAAASTTSVSRAAVVVSKQVAKRATQRNQLRRRVQALLPSFLDATTQPTDVLVRLSPAAAAASPRELRRSLTTLWPTHGVTQSRPAPRHRRTPPVPAHPVPRP